ncbi:MAG: hypothetical protein DRI57_25645 [Deltaproteobacteria bacterium]|nr:MAG: hypothetical protein DRI57_25645 [Deltaproteobacteria bacterium]
MSEVYGVLLRPAPLNRLERNLLAIGRWEIFKTKFSDYHDFKENTNRKPQFFIIRMQKYDFCLCTGQKNFRFPDSL